MAEYTVELFTQYIDQLNRTENPTSSILQKIDELVHFRDSNWSSSPIVSYSEEKECEICDCTFREGFMFKPCNHVYCLNCVKKNTSTAISQGSHQIKCLSGCSIIPMKIVLDQLISDESEKKQFITNCYNQFRLNHRRDIVRVCPECYQEVIVEPGTIRVTCPRPECRKDVCLNCRCIYHEGITCDQYDWKKDSLSSSIKKYLEGYAQRCPNCKIIIERNQGCNHMTCDKSKGGCGTQFCYFCGELWDGGRGHGNPCPKAKGKKFN